MEKTNWWVAGTEIATAGGTLILAGVSALNVWVVRHLATDEASHRAHVSGFELRGVLTRSDANRSWRRLPTEAEREDQHGTEYALAMEVRLRNDGRGTAYVQIYDACEEVESSRPLLYSDDGMVYGKRPGVSNESYALPAGQVLAFIVAWWRPAIEWIDELGRLNDEPDYVPTTSFRMRCAGGLKPHPLDQFKLTFGAFPLDDVGAIRDFESEDQSGSGFRRIERSGLEGKRRYPNSTKKIAVQPGTGPKIHAERILWKPEELQ